MTLDLLHNKIIKETLTEGFEKSVNDNLIPKLYALYGTSLDGIQFYEDYINDDFIKDGYWYYPLTVIIGGIYAVRWIKWDISEADNYRDGNPYSFVGEGQIDFLLTDDIPIAFKNSIEGRSNYFEGGCVKLNVTTDAPNPKILAGKYSQTFIDEMNRQLSAAISRACGVEGLEDSSIELDIVFAPNTYMEHTSENVTYRRLLISAKGCSARDFWIKWTRKNSSVAYSVNDNVSSEDIVFELGEDVSQKIREKEYRFLVYGNSDKYRVAMGRKNVTEWRDLIKRALKRGELVKTTNELEENAHVAEVSDKLSEILEKCGVSVPVSTSSDIRVEAEVANEALRLAVLGNGESESENYVPEIPVAEEVVAEEISYTENAEETKDADTEESTDVGALIENLDSSEDGEFDFSKSDDVFELAGENTEELSFEDILEQFIPKSDNDEDEAEALPDVENVDISDVDESDTVRFSISKSDAAPFDLDEEQESNESAPFDLDEENKSDAEEEIEIELYEQEPSEDEISDSGIYSAKTEDNVEAAETDVVEQEEQEAELPDVSYVDNENLVRLENEIANLKHQLEIERIAKEGLQARLNDVLMEKIEVENNLASEREAREVVENQLRSAAVAKENAENQMNLELTSAQDLRAQNEKQRFAIEQVKKLLDEQTAARENAEAELELLRSEIEAIRSDNEHLKEIARVSEEACREAEAMCKRHERELLNQIELSEKERVREKNLFAEAARAAKEENEQRFAELKEAEIARIEEEARIEALHRAEYERQILLEELRNASEAKDNEEALKAAEEEKRKKALEDRAREARLRMEQRARLNAEAKASAWGDYVSASSPVYESSVVPEETEEVLVPQYTEPEIVEENVIEQTPAFEPTPAPVVNYTYTSYIVRLMFRRSADPNVTARIHEMISYALTDFGKDHVYMKVKASMPDNYTVILNFVKFPKEEFDLLVNIINYLGKSDLGLYKAVLD